MKKIKLFETKQRNVRWFFASVLVVALAVIGVAATTNTASAKYVTNKKEIEKVEQKMYGTKSGKYTYYYCSHKWGLVRSNGKKTQMLVKWRVVREVKISGKYVYYCADSGLFRVRKDGKKKMKLPAGSATSIDMIKDGYVYYRYGWKLARIRTNGEGGKQILVYDKKTGMYRVFGDRVYYVKHEKVPEDSGSVYSTVYSKKLDGTDKQLEWAQSEGDFQIYISGGKLVLVNSEGAYVRVQQGVYEKVENSDIALADDNKFLNAGKRLFFGPSKLTPETELLYYEYDENFSKKLVVNAEGIRGEIRGERVSFRRIGGYYVLISEFEYYGGYDALFVFDGDGNYIRKVDLIMSGEDYAAHYTIKDGVLYVEKYNDSRRRTERHIYKL